MRLGGNYIRLILIYYKRKSDGMSRAPAFFEDVHFTLGMLSDFCYSGNRSSYMMDNPP